MHWRRWILQTIVVLSTAAIATAGSGTVSPGLPLMKVYEASEHRAGPQTFDLAQDRSGILYFGNLHGLLTYDGAWWRLIELPDSQVPMSLETDRSGQVAMGLVNDFGLLTRGPDGSPQFRSLLPLLPENERDLGDVVDLCATSRGFVFVSDRRVILSDGRTARTILEAGENGPRGCFADGDGVLLRGPGGLTFLDLRTLRSGPPITSGRVSAVLRDRGGNLRVFVRGEGLFTLTGTTLAPWAPDASKWLREKPVTGAAALADGRVAVATRQDGLIVIGADGTLERTIDDDAGLPNAVLNELFVDRDGSLWLAMEGPLVRIDTASPVTVIDERTGVKGQVADVAWQRDRLHVSTSHGLYAMRDDGTAESVAGFTNAWRMVKVGEDLFVAASQRLFRLKPDGTRETILDQQGDISDVLPSKVNPNRVWIAGRRGVGVVSRTGEGWQLERFLANTPGDAASLVERYGVLWAGTVFDGVIRIEDPLGSTPRVTRYGTGEMNVFEVDGRVVVVDATAGRILQAVDTTSASGATSHALSPDKVLGHIRVPGEFFVLGEDSAGNLWLNSIPPHVVKRRPDGSYEPEARPLASVYSTDIQTIRTDQDGVVWFASDRGLFRYRAQNTGAVSPQPAPLIRKVSTGLGTLIFGGWGDSGAPRLRHDFGRIRVDFAPGTFVPGVTYQYRLDPADADWSAWTDQASVDFTTLSPGRYTLRLRARPASGNASVETRWSFEVVPPWYRTLWAMAIWLLLAVLAIVALFRLRTRALRRHAEELRAQVAEQTTQLNATVGMLEQTNHELQEAQEKLARFNESSGEALRDVRSWSKVTANDVAASVHAREIVVSIVSGGELVPVAPTEVRPPRLEELEMLPHKNTFLTTVDGHAVLPVPGLTGRVFGALTIAGKSGTWTEPERQLLSTFAHQLGGALELQQVRNDLADARERNALARRQMTSAGISLAKVCVKCSRCFADEAIACPVDGGELDGTRILPYLVAGRYRLERLLGAGGMGEVFAARDERLERAVAVKVIKAAHFNDANVRARFEREARAVARVHHPNVVAIHDSGELEEGSAYIVTELLEGCDLGYVLRRHGRGSPRQVASLLRQGAAALAAAHAAGLIHRDIKPANLFLVTTAGGFQVKLLDFGIAKSVDLETQFTHSGTLVGTPAYMAPEQVTRGHADATTDLYSFAAVAYESLLGTRVSGSTGGFAALWDVMYSEPARPSTIRPILSAEIDAAFAAALAKSADARPRDVEAWAAALAADLERIDSDEVPWPARIAKETLSRFVTIASTLPLDVAPNDGGPTAPVQ